MVLQTSDYSARILNRNSRGANSSELSADVSADSLNPEQLAAQLRDLDRSELEQLLLTLLSKAESEPE